MDDKPVFPVKLDNEKMFNYFIHKFIKAMVHKH